MERTRGAFKRPALVAAVAAGVFVVAGSAVATTAAVNATIRPKSAKKTAVVRFDGPPQTTGTSTFQDIPGTQAAITFTKPSILLVTLTAESSFFNLAVSGAASNGRVGILADAAGELGPGFGGNFAFDSSDRGTESQSSFE